MSRIPISPDDPDLGHLANGVIATGEDRASVNHITEPGELAAEAGYDSDKVVPKRRTPPRDE